MKRKFQINTHRLANGLQICAVRYPDIRAVSIRCFVFTGSAFETPQNNGISHFLEHMLFRGNEKLGTSNTLNLCMEELGGELNAVTSFDLTELWLDFHVDYLEKGIERFCQFLQYPLYKQIETERSIILEEIRADYGENDLLIDLDSLVAKELWNGHPMSLPVTGSVDSITPIAKSDLSLWFETFYQPGNMIIGITGDFDPQHAINKISTQFPSKQFSARKNYPAIENSDSIGEQIQLIHQKDNQFNLLWTFPAYPLTPELRVQYQLIRRILDDGSSSRLQQLVREERGLVYDISAEMLYFLNGVSLNIQSQVSVNQFSALIDVLVGLIKQLGDKGCTEDELKLAKLRTQIALDFNEDIPHGILYDEIGPDIHPCVSSFNKTRSLVEEIDLTGINKTLQSLLSSSQTCFAVVGPCEDEQRQLLEEALNRWIA